MLQAMPVKLETNEDEKALLLATMKKYNEAANFLAEQAFRLKLANKVELQKRFYRQLREQFNLSAQFAVRVISKVVEAYKRDKRVKPRFRDLGAIQYDQRNMSWKGLDRVSLITLQGRIKLRTRIGEYQTSRADRIRRQADLIYRNGVFYLIAVVDAAEQSEFDPVGVLGVDLGIENIATDSDGKVFSGEKVEQVRKRYNKLRAGLQKAKATSRHNQRDRHSKWSFGQLRQFVAYKAKRDGVPVRIVNPRNTSRECPKCHNIDARNRPKRSQFKCTECGYEAMADYVAACNIAARALVKEPIVAPVFSAVTSPHRLRVGA